MHCSRNWQRDSIRFRAFLFAFNLIKTNNYGIVLFLHFQNFISAPPAVKFVYTNN